MAGWLEPHRPGVGRVADVHLSRLDIGRGARCRFLGFAILSWTIGDFVLTAESLGGATPPTPSYADIFYLAFYPLAYVATFMLLQRGLGRLARPNWLDGVVAGLGAAALCAAFAFHSIEHVAGTELTRNRHQLGLPRGRPTSAAPRHRGIRSALGARDRALVSDTVGFIVIVIGDTVNLFSNSAAFNGRASAATSTTSPGRRRYF